MYIVSSMRRVVQAIAATLLLQAGVAAAQGVDTYSTANNQLTMPFVMIGDAIFSNMVVTVKAVVSGPTGSSPNGTVDIYDPSSNELTVRSVKLGANTYYNVVCTVKALVSIGGVTGADTYHAGEVTIPSVLVDGGPLIANYTVITVGGIVSPGGGMPANVRDLYNTGNNELTIAAIELQGFVYTNAIVTVGSIVSLAGTNIPTSLIGVVSNTGKAGSYTSNVSLWNLADRGSPTQVATLNNPGNVISIAIDPSNNAYFLTANGSFYSCPAAAQYVCSITGSPGAITNAQWLAVDGRGNAYATDMISIGEVGVVKFPTSTGPAAGDLPPIYTSASPPGRYTGLAVSPDGTALYVGEAAGTGIDGTGVTMHACSNPCSTPGGADVTHTLVNAAFGSSFYGVTLSGAVSFGPGNSIYVGAGIGNGNNSTAPNEPYVAAICTATGSVASPTGFTCTPGQGGGIYGYPPVNGTQSPFAQTVAIASDASGNAYVAADLAVGQSPPPMPATLSALAPPASGVSFLGQLVVTGPPGPAPSSSTSWAPYAIAVTPKAPPAAPPAVFVIDSTNTLFSYDASGNLLHKVALGAPVGKLNGGGITLANGIVYVTVGPAASGKVLAFNSSTLQPITLNQGSFSGLSTPVGIAFDPHNSQFYVADFQLNEVSTYGSGGNLITQTTSPGAAGIAFSSANDSLWVANFQGEPSASLIINFDEALTFVQTINTTSQFLPPNNLTATDNPVAVAYCATSGNPPSTANVVSLGFIGDSIGVGASTVQSYTLTGGDYGPSFVGTITNPHAMSCSSFGNIYVAADDGLLEYNITGSYLGPAAGTFTGLTAPIFGVYAAY